MAIRVLRLIPFLVVVALTLSTPTPVAAQTSFTLTEVVVRTGGPDNPTGTAVPGSAHEQITVEWTPAETGTAAVNWQVRCAPTDTTSTSHTSSHTNLAASTRTVTCTGLTTGESATA